MHVPRVYEDLTSARVLVMSFEEGFPINQVRNMVHADIDLRKVANLVSLAFSQMIFKDGFVHADPHPGNLLVRKENGIHKLILLDHGVYTTLK